MNQRRTFLWGIAGGVGVAGALLLFVLLGGQRGNEFELFALRADSLADEILRTWLQGQEMPELPPGVLGFGLYDTAGNRKTSLGEAPQHLEAEVLASLSGRRSIQDRGNGVYDIVRDLSPMGQMAMRQGMMQQGPPAQGRRSPRTRNIQGFVFLRLAMPDIDRSLRAWELSRWILPAAWLLVVAMAGLLVHRQQRYRQTLAHNRELLQFAEAGRTLVHEIKNPLAAILLQTALLKRSARSRGAEPEPELGVIESEAERISQLANRIRDMVRDPLGNPGSIDLAGFLQGVAERFGPMVAIEIDTGCPARIWADTHRMRSVLDNLVRNAVEASPAGEAIILRAGGVGGHRVRIEILDRGEGFGPEALKRACTPFFTTKVQGSGIGMSIARTWVEALGGSLKFGNRRDGGAWVSLELPTAAREESR